MSALDGSLNKGRSSGNELFSRSDLKKLILPLMMEQTLALTVGMIDTIMVAAAGESAVSGVSLVDTINILIINLFAALAAGGAIVAGQYLGKRDLENASRAAKQLVLATFVLSLLIMLACLVWNGEILFLIFKNTDEGVMRSARIYFYTAAASYPFIALYNAAAALFRGMGNSKIAMVNALIMNVVNIVGNAILIYGLGLGVLGAGLATLLSRFIAGAVILYMLRNPALAMSVRSYHLRDVDWGMIKRILRIGIPNGLENSMFQIGKIIVVGLVVLGGTTAIAANAVSNSLAAIEIIPGAAVGLALTTVVARCVGAGEYEQADYYIRYLMKIAYMCMVVLNIGMLIGLRPILQFYRLSPETLQLASRLMTLHSICVMLIWPISFSLPNAFRAAGDVKYPMFISILSMWIFRIGLSYAAIYYFKLGVFGIWMAMIVDWIFRSICFMIRWFSGRWRKKSIAEA